MASLADAPGGFWLALMLPVSAGLVFLVHCPWAFVFAVGVVFPILDALIGVDKSTTHHDDVFENALIPHAYLFIWLCAMVVGIERAHSARAIEMAGVILASGLLSATTMAHIHEVMHRTNRLSRLVADFAFIVAGYATYLVRYKQVERAPTDTTRCCTPMLIRSACLLNQG